MVRERAMFSSSKCNVDKHYLLIYIHFCYSFYNIDSFAFKLFVIFNFYISFVLNTYCLYKFVENSVLHKISFILNVSQNLVKLLYQNCKYVNLLYLVVLKKKVK